MMMDARPSRIARSAKAFQADAIETGFVAREAWAFEVAYDTYRPHLYGAAYAVLQDAGDAEDCVHDVLMRLWRHGHGYTRARGSLHAFLVVCVRNEALARRRTSLNRARIARERMRVDESMPPPDENAVDRVDMSRLLQRLNEAQQQAIRLAYYDGLTHEQIAELLGEPVGTVKSRLSNALVTLRRLLPQGRNE